MPASATNPAPTKTRILDATAELFRRYGYTGTGLKQVVAEANAPFGSLYHHFPGGKQELGVEVIHRAGRMYMELVVGIIAAAPDLVSGVGDAFTGAADLLVETDYADACPIATIALEVASTNESLRVATAEVFESWIAGCGAALVAAGIEAANARVLAIVLIMQLEGAFLLCRATKSTEAMQIAGDSVVAAVRAALPTNARQEISARRRSR